MIRKTLGYVLAALGVVGVAAWTFPDVKSSIPNFPDLISVIGGDTGLIIASIVLVVIGLFIVVKGSGSSKKMKEVPIYQGKNIVGYRRH